MLALHRMRDAARKMEEKHFPNRTTEHVEFLPVEWRSKLTLDGGKLSLQFLFATEPLAIAITVISENRKQNIVWVYLQIVLSIN